MADAPAGRTPNRSLAMLFLLVTALGSIVMVAYGTWLLFEEKRLSGFAWLSFGLVWFLFFSWLSRAALRPGPQG